MVLQELVANIPCEIIGDKSIEIKGIVFNSREVKEGDMFVALSPKGELYVKEAIKRGARAIAGSNPDKKIEVPIVISPNPRQFLARISRRFYSYPDTKLRLIGITGTNGKTTTSYLLKTILEEAGIRTGMIGTLGYFTGERWIEGINTTPESLILMRLLREMIENGMEYCILEVSSHGLAMDRVYGLSFIGAVFTNLSQDHLDFHKNMEDYKTTKLKLFKNLEKGTFAVLNLDDPVSQEIETKAKKLFYGVRNETDVKAVMVEHKKEKMIIDLKVKGEEIRIDFPLIGEYNLYNLTCAAAVAYLLGFSLKTVKRGIEKFQSPKGRVERVITDKGFSVYIDYAHTPEALKSVILALRKVTKGKLIVVFGCGGDRDEGKRPEMGRIATGYADFVILTNDNPREEPPEEIIRGIERGITKKNYEIVMDRRKAIEESLQKAESEDTVLIAGKGHEDYQIIKNRKVPFSDKKVVRKCLQQMS